MCPKWPTGEIPAVSGATQPPSLGYKHSLKGTFFSIEKQKTNLSLFIGRG